MCDPQAFTFSGRCQKSNHGDIVFQTVYLPDKGVLLAWVFEHGPYTQPKETCNVCEI